MEAQKQPNSTFLSLAPTSSSPPASPTTTKSTTSAINSPVDNKTPVPTDAIEPLQRIRSDSTESSTSSKSTGFLKLNPDAED